MEPSAALIAGLTAGLAIAVQVGVVSLLLVESAVVRGPRSGVAAGMGVATADLGFAVIAAVAGAAAGAALAGHEGEIRVFAALVVAAIALHGLVAIARDRSTAGPVAGEASSRPVTEYARFLAITAANPLTIASFAAVAAASPSRDRRPRWRSQRVSAWPRPPGTSYSRSRPPAGRWMTPRVRRGLAIAGRVAVLVVAAHLAFG